MARLGLNIGDILQMQFLGDESETRYYVKVIGYLEDRSLLVTAPQSNGKLLRLREGQMMAARLMAGTDLIGFTVSVQRICIAPYPYLHLSFPKDFQRVTVRKSLRIDLGMKARVQPCEVGGSEPVADAEPVEVLVRDMSTTGALLEAGAPLADTGDCMNLAMELEVAGVPEAMAFTTVVRNIKIEPAKEKGETSRFLHGVEFQFSDRRESVLLHAFVYEQIVHRRGE